MKKYKVEQNRVAIGANVYEIGEIIDKEIPVKFQPSVKNLVKKGILIPFEDKVVEPKTPVGSVETNAEKSKRLKAEKKAKEAEAKKQAEEQSKKDSEDEIKSEVEVTAELPSQPNQSN